MDNENAVILLSGGLDSATAAAVAVRDSSACSAITFRYGQRHKVEVESARKLSAFFGIGRHLIIDIPVDVFQRNALNPSSGIDVPKNRDLSRTDAVPDTYVPARNTLFLAYALAFAESSGIRLIYIGVNALDYSGYPDCRPGYIAAFERMANLGTREGVEGRGFSIRAPLISMSKSDIIRLGRDLGVDYSLTHSCYDPGEDGVSCGECDSCVLRRRGFIEAGVADPTRYRK
ncbi:MAG TPA: 7-cyano-7-deazaguanine synthase QueC [Spirochaetota bacterium]|nr:7-cyano-7-deazaguanine synthase QueC [Spirochaetota bacterium]